MLHAAVLETLQPRRHSGLRLSRRLFRRSGGALTTTRVHALDHDSPQMRLCARSASMMWPLERNFEDLEDQDCCHRCLESTAGSGAMV
jgi:hypothetical protein